MKCAALEEDTEETEESLTLVIFKVWLDKAMANLR